jgi:predicted dehydrogenase
LGWGWWGNKLTESRPDVPHLRIVAGVEPNAPAVRDFAARCRFPIHGDMSAVLADPVIHAVILATPHALHESQIAAAAAAGKHVFCEKPLALTRGSAERSVKLCAERGLVLGIGHERRFEPPVAAMIQDARAGVFGKLMQYEGNFSHDKFTALTGDNWRLSPVNAPAGGMTATGIHLFDLATALFGEAESAFTINATLATAMPAGDTTSSLVRYRNGASAYVAAMLATPFISKMALFGSEGWCEIRDKAHVEASAGWVVTRCRKGGAPTTEEVPSAETVRENLRAFARAIRGLAPYPIPSAEIVANAAVMEAVFRSAATGRLESVPS